MDRLEEQLLDYETPEGPQFGDNKLVIGARYGISVFLVGNIAKTFILAPAYQSGPNLAYYLGILIPISVYLLFTYYNLVQAKMEKGAKKIYPAFRKPFIILCIAGCFLISLLNIFRIGSSPIISLLIIALCLIILRREFRYFKLIG